MSLKFSQDIQVLLAKLATKPMAIADIIQETAERGFSLIISLLVLPFLLPMPPGLSGIIGTSCLILGMQMALGRKLPWLPPKIAQFEFPSRVSRLLLKNIKRIVVCLERIVRSRWRRLAGHAYTSRINGLCIAWLSILLMLPIPFTNPLPAITILCLTTASMERDGLLMCIGYVLTLIDTIFFCFIGYALWQAPRLLPDFWQ